MNNLYRLILFIGLIITISPAISAQAADVPAKEPDSVYTKKYIVNICITEPYRALKLIDEMSRRKMLPDYQLDYLRSVTYQNGLTMYRLALDYSLRAYRNDSIQRNPADALALLELITDQYNITGNYTESMRYAVEGAELAKQTGNIRAEANLLLYMSTNKRDMGLKSEAEPYMEKAIALLEKAAEGSRKWKAVDDLIYIYGTKLSDAFEDNKFHECIALLPRYEELMEQLKACPDVPEGVYDMRLTCVYALFAALYANNGQTEKADEFYRKYLATAYAGTDDGKQLRFDYLIARKRYKEALRYIDENKQFCKAQGDTVSYFYLEQNLNFAAQAYMGLGDYKSAARTYKQMYALSDSLRIREKQNGVLEFATLYETREKDAQLMTQATRLRESRMIQIFAVCVIVLLGFLLWRNIRHSRIVKAKNKAMGDKIEALLGYKDELFRRKEENLNLKEQLQAAEKKLQKRNSVAAAVPPVEDVAAEEDNTTTIVNGQSLFDRVEHEIVGRKLFLQPDFSRDDLMKLVRIPKNKFALLFKQYAGMGFTQYINNLRLDYAARMLKEHPEYAVDAVAGECGIPNKSTFHRLFLEQFNMTPAEYRESKKIVDN